MTTLPNGQCPNCYHMMEPFKAEMEFSSYKVPVEVFPSPKGFQATITCVECKTTYNVQLQIK